MKKKALVICGPTSSGKTIYAHHLARRYNGAIINADSQQIYKQIPIITASPSSDLKEELPYCLYNFQCLTEEFSVASYLKLAVELIREASSNNLLPIITGGTGMYIAALISGFSQIPQIEASAREEVRSLYRQIGPEDFFIRLTKLDPIAGQKLNASDTQRILRAYEVVMVTGYSIYHFQQELTSYLPDYEFRVIMLNPDRQFLYECCNKRLKEMVDAGVIDEIEALHNLSPEILIKIKAIGVEEIIQYLAGKLSLSKAVELAQAKTRQYAKRQVTWFKHQIKDKEIISFASKQEFADLIARI